jgi:uncharacterized membrane protein
MPLMTTLQARPLALERLVYFSDAVFAIAITLLVLDIKVPELAPDIARAELTHHLIELTPRIAGYVLSFLVIGVYWEAHHRMFGFIKVCTRTLIWLNFVELMLIAFLPFPTALIGRYAAVPIALVWYACTVIAVGLARTAIWAYVSSGCRLLDGDTPVAEVRAGLWRGLTPPVIFALSLPLAYRSPVIAMLSWIAIFPVLRLIDWRARTP